MRAYVTTAGMALGLVAVWAVLVPLVVAVAHGCRGHVVKGHVTRPAPSHMRSTTARTGRSNDRGPERLPIRYSRNGHRVVPD